MINLSLDALYYGKQYLLSIIGCIFAAYIIAKAGKPLIGVWEKIARVKPGEEAFMRELATLLLGIALFVIWLLLMIWFIAYGAAFAIAFHGCMRALIIN